MIFREGEESHEAYFIVSGAVQIFTTSAGARRVLADLGPGEVFGEMGMVEESPRSASAQALEDTELEVVTEETFEQELLQKPDRLLRYLGTLFERLRRSNAALKAEIQKSRADHVRSTESHTEALVYGADEAPEGAEQSVSVTGARLRLHTADPEADTAKVDLEISKFPFRIGRVSWQGGRSPSLPNDLSVPDEVPFDVSRSHCVIERRGNRLYVSDVGSTLGTIVNGIELGTSSGRLSYELEQEENELILGPADSPHRFKLIRLSASK